MPQIQLESKGLELYDLCSQRQSTAGETRFVWQWNQGCQILVVSSEGIAKDALDVAFSVGIPVIMFEDGVTDGYTALVQGTMRLPVKCRRV